MRLVCALVLALNLLALPTFAVEKVAKPAAAQDSHSDKALAPTAEPPLSSAEDRKSVV